MRLFFLVNEPILLHIRRAVQLDSCWVTQGRSHTTELFVCMFVLFSFLIYLTCLPNYIGYILLTGRMVMNNGIATGGGGQGVVMKHFKVPKFWD